MLSQPNKTSVSISLVSNPGGCSLTGLSVIDIWVFDFGWICWESPVPPATSEPNSFIQLSLKEIFGGGRGDSYTFSYMISPVSIIIAFGIQLAGSCVVKDDCVRSCLIELKSFLLSKFYVDPLHCVLMYFQLFCLYHARRRASRSMLFGSLCSLFIGSTDVKNTVCLSLPKFCPSGINSEFVMECKLIANPM